MVARWVAGPGPTGGCARRRYRRCEVGGGSVQVGRVTCTVPSVMETVQLPWCRSMWWRRQRRTRLETFVSPPSIQDTR